MYNATSTVYKAKDTIAIYVENGWSVWANQRIVLKDINSEMYTVQYSM